MKRKGNRAIRFVGLLTMAAIAIASVLSNGKIATAVVASFDTAWNWTLTREWPSYAQYDTIYVGNSGNAIKQITANTSDGTVVLPISAEAWIGRDSNWRMGLLNMHVSINGTNKRKSFWDEFWYPWRQNASPVWNGGRLLYYANIKIGDAKFDVSDLPSGNYVVTLTVDSPLSSSSVKLEPPYSVTANVKLINPWHIDGRSYIGNSGRVSGNNSNANNRISSNENAFTVRPNQKLYFDHDLRNIDKSTMSQNLNINVNRQFRSLDNGAQLSFTSNPANVKAKGGPNELFYINHNDYTVTQDDVNKKICQRVEWSPNSWDQAWAGQSKYVCANVPYHYPGCQASKNCTTGSNDPPAGDCTFNGGCSGGENDNNKAKNGITPTTSANKSETMVGEQISFTYNFSNKGPTKSKQLNYRAYTFILKAGQTISSTIKAGPRAYAKNWGSGGVGIGGRGVSQSKTSKWVQTAAGSGVVYPSAKSGSLSTVTTNLNMKDWLASPGDQICSYVAIDKWNVYNGREANTYLASNIACVRVGKKPQIQISGSDSYAKKGFEADSNSTSLLAGVQHRGSYSQYSLLTGSGGSKANRNFGSGGYTTSTTYRNQACRLAVANTASATGTCVYNTLTWGGLSKQLSVPNRPTTTRAVSGSVINLDSLASGDYRHTGNVTIRGSLPTGRRVNLFVDGSVTIDSNIVYGGNTMTQTYSGGVSNIPNLTVVAGGNINVGASVNQIAGNYVTKNGRFNTCAGVSSGNSDSALGINGVCHNKLVINGSVVTSSGLNLHRTFGSGNVNAFDQYDTNNISSTSEWFNYTPNVWLTQVVSQDEQRSVYGFRTNSVADVPVRY